MRKTALITGASSGIGRDLARVHAETGGDLVVVARREKALEDLKEELEIAYGVSVEVIASDLTEHGAAGRIYDELAARGKRIDILINNAGFGGHGKFCERDWADDEAMIQLNVLTLCHLTHLFLKDMAARGDGKILNVASTAGFLPGPLQAVYYATKAFVLSFSQAVAEEMSGSGVTVTALCPGPVETEFSERASLEGVTAFKFTASSMDVARCGYSAMQKGKLVAINDWKIAFLLNCVLPLFPRKTVLKISRKSMEK